MATAERAAPQLTTGGPPVSQILKWIFGAVLLIDLDDLASSATRDALIEVFAWFVNEADRYDAEVAAIDQA